MGKELRPACLIRDGQKKTMMRTFPISVCTRIVSSLNDASFLVDPRGSATMRPLLQPNPRPAALPRANCDRHAASTRAFPNNAPEIPDQQVNKHTLHAPVFILSCVCTMYDQLSQQINQSSCLLERDPFRPRQMLKTWRAPLSSRESASSCG